MGVKCVRRASASVLYIFFLLVPAPAKAQPTTGPETDGILEVNDSDWPPYFYAGHKRFPGGFAKELLLHCFAENKVRAIFRHVPIKRAQKELESGALDVNVFSRDERRESFLAFGSEPLFTSEYRPFVRAGSTIKIQKMDDFKGLKIGNLGGLVYTPEFMKLLESQEKRGLVSTFNEPELGLKMLVSGKIDIFLNTVPTVIWHQKKSGIEGKVRPIDFVLKENPYYVAVSKKSSRIRDIRKFLDRLDHCVRNTKKSPFFSELRTKYGL